VTHFLNYYNEANDRYVVHIQHEAMEALQEYHWPGNVRELQNCVERAVVLARYDEITPDELPPKVQSARPVRGADAGDVAAELVPLDVVERRHILGVLDQVGGRRGRAAEILGIDRKTLYRKLERWGFAIEGDGHAEA
jgi:DNA-binding NtrC family response regulator